MSERIKILIVATAALIAFIAVLYLFYWAVTYYRGKQKYPRKETFDEFIQVHGFKIRFQRFGKGPPLVLIHGIGASLYCWRLVAGDLAKRFDLLLLDLPGFGESQKKYPEDYGLDAQTERLVGFLDRLKIKQATLVGCSMGGAIALWAARRFPNRFPKIITIAPATNPRTVPLGLRSVLPLASVLQLAVNRMTVGWILRRLVSDQTLITEEAIQKYLQPYVSSPLSYKTFVLATSLLLDQRLPHGLSEVSSEVLILWGRADQLVSERFMSELEKILSTTKTVIHPTAGHHIMEDDPAWVVDLILKFTDDRIV